MTGLDFSPASLARGASTCASRPVPTSGSSSPTSTRRSTSSARAASISSSPASARSAGSPTSGRWARSCRRSAPPGGRLFLREAHPVLWSLAERDPTTSRSDYPYLEPPEPPVWNDPDLRRHRRRASRTSVTQAWTMASARSSRRYSTRPGAHRPRRARQRTVERPARARWSGRRGEWRLLDRPFGCRSPTPCRPSSAADRPRRLDRPCRPPAVVEAPREGVGETPAAKPLAIHPEVGQRVEPAARRRPGRPRSPRSGAGRRRRALVRRRAASDRSRATARARRGGRSTRGGPG